MIVHPKMTLGLALSAIVISGCATQQTETASTANADLQKTQRELAQLESQLSSKDSELARIRNELERAQTQASATPAPMPASSSLFPPDPKPGECYARVLIPAQYKTSTKQVLKREASERIEIIPAKYGPGKERILVKEASTKLEVRPAVYETVSETVMVQPASTKLVEVPAKYQTVSESILDKPAHTVWKRGAAQAGNALQTSVDESTGEIMCLVEVPATYKTVSKTVLVSPARTEKVEVPAKYETVTKRVLKMPAQTLEVEVPAEYKTIDTTVLIQPASERRIPIPAEYETVSLREKITDERLEWRRVLCDVNLTPNNIMTLQRELKDAGFYTGPVDGVLGPLTVGASNAYAKAKGLPSGSNYIPVEVAKSLGLQI